ncbi:MAG: alkaline phosphatase family protein [Flavobacteriales bacterium]|nr:alkaline phosphatase family protein [Flavobacteriales bacterium]MCB9196734.1 alkaline phosphatase family protein [Flavobacteriales bacterium]MCB9197733.1 alkaline phosphatase family protein [Flavobacteriales bacterium]
MRFIAFSFFVFLISYPTFSQIVAGPMLGNMSDNEIEYWVMTQNAFRLYAGKKGEGISNQKGNYKIIEESLDPTFDQLLSSDKIYKGYKSWKISFPASDLAAGDSLIFAPIYIDFSSGNGQVVEFNEQKIVPYEEHNYDEFLIGSCAYIGKGFSKIYRPWNVNKIYNTMAREDADHMLWLGDNIYLILNHDLKDSASIYKRYVGVRKTKKLDNFLTCGMEHYTTWDDHDYGPNNSDGSFEGKEITTNIFQDMWCNPDAEGPEGIYYKITKGNAEIFMTDGRSFRNNDGSAMLGDMQLEWLKEGLKSSNAPFKIIVIGSQVIQKAPGHESYVDFPEERKEFFDFLEAEKISGVIFFSGDRHHTEVAKMEREGSYPLYDITCSPISSPRPKFRGWGPEGKSENRVNDLFITRHNYGKCSITGPNDNLKLTIEFKLPNGKVKDTFIVEMKDLGY